MEEMWDGGTGTEDPPPDCDENPLPLLPRKGDGDRPRSGSPQPRGPLLRLDDIIPPPRPERVLVPPPAGAAPTDADLNETSPTDSSGGTVNCCTEALTTEVGTEVTVTSRNRLRFRGDRS